MLAAPAGPSPFVLSDLTPVTRFTWGADPMGLGVNVVQFNVGIRVVSGQQHNVMFYLLQKDDAGTVTPYSSWFATPLSAQMSGSMGRNMHIRVPGVTDITIDLRDFTPVPPGARVPYTNPPTPGRHYQSFVVRVTADPPLPQPLPHGVRPYVPHTWRF